MGGTKRVAVIGAGPAGATAAYVLAKRGAGVDVFEAAGTVGGSARSVELWGQTVDLGPQRFASDDPRVEQLWREVVGEDHEMVDGHTRILFRGRLYADPLHPGDVLRNLGPAEAARCLAGYGLQRVRPGRRSGDTVESWVTARFGPRLYRHFFQVYAEKLAGVPAARLDAELADQRIGGLALRETARTALRREPGRRLGREFGPGPRLSPTDRFAHPRRGTGEVYRRMCEFVECHGGRVHLETPLAGLVTAGGAVTGLRLATGETRDYDHVVAALPLAGLVARLPDVPAEVAAAGRALTFRACVIVYLQVGAERLFAGTWVRVPGPELRTGRITNFGNWAPAIRNGQRETVLAMEYWCDAEDDFWRWEDRNHVALARQEIVRSGLVRPNQIVDGAVVRVPRARPVHRRDHLARLGMVEDHLRGLTNLEVVGRHLAGPDGDQGQGVRMGLLAAENVLDAAGHDLWRAT